MDDREHGGEHDRYSRIYRERQRRKQRRRRRRKLLVRSVQVGLTVVLLAAAAGVIWLNTAGKVRGDSEAAGALLQYGEEPEEYGAVKAAASGRRGELLRGLEELARSDARAEEILKQEEFYTEDMLELPLKYPETLDFVLEYPEKKDSSPAETVGEVGKGEIPLLIQWDERWGYETYGTGLLGYTGCGPTALAMVAAGLTGDNTVTPVRVAEYAETNGYYEAGAGTAWSLMTEGCEAFGISGCELPLSRESIQTELEAGNPVICSVGPGDFTDKGHFIVLIGMQDGKIRLNDPNSRENSEMLWDYERLEGQIKNLWYFTENGR